MSPDKRPARRASSKRPTAAKLRPSPDDPYQVVHFQRHKDDDPAQAAPGRVFFAACPPKVRVTMAAMPARVVLAAPPHRFAGGGKSEAMHGEMSGYPEARVDGPGRPHDRLLSRLDTDAGALGEEYLKWSPRSLAQ